MNAQAFTLLPIMVDIANGSEHDAKIAPRVIDQLDINKDAHKNAHNKTSHIAKNKENEKYILADKGYDSEKIREIIRKKYYIPLIVKRKCNKKAKTLNKHQLKIFRKRIIVENFFSWLKAFLKIDRIYEKTVESYRGLLLLAISIIIFKKYQ